MAMRNVKLDVEDLQFIEMALATQLQNSTWEQKRVQALIEKIRKNREGIKRKTAKSKGLQFQFDICAMISRITGRPWVQGSDDSEIFSRLSGQSGTDVGLRGEARKLFPFACECKNTETFSINAVMEQAKANATPEMPALIFHKNKALAEPVVVMEVSTFERLARINTLYILGEFDK